MQSGAFDTEPAIFPEEALAFIRETQSKTGEKLDALHGAETGERVLQELTKRLRLEQERIGYDFLRAVLRGLQTATSKEYLTVQRRRSLPRALLCNDTIPSR